MNLNSINQIFKRIVIFQLKYRMFFIAAILVFTVIGALGLRKIYAITGQDSFSSPDKEKIKKEKLFEELFGNNENIVLLIEADDVFKPEVLKVINEIGNELLEKVPFADYVTSITNIDITVGTEEGIEINNPFKDGIPENPDELKKAKDFILSRESIVNKLVSADSKETWLILSLKAYPEESVWSKLYDKEPMLVDGEAAIKVVTNPKYKSTAYSIKPAGLPYTETEEKIVMGKEMAKAVILGFICMIILLVVFSKSLRGTLVPIFATISALITVFGIMGHLHITVYTTMASLPIVLAMALSVGYSIHLLNSFRHYFYKTRKRRESVIASVENTGWPLFFTVITTIASVLSFLTTELHPVRWVGVTCAGTVGAVYIYVSILIPILMSYGKDELKKQDKNAEKFQKVDLYFEKFGDMVIKKRKAVLITFAIITAACVPALFMIDVNMDSFNFMGLRIPYVKRVYDITQSQLGAYFNYNIMLTFDESDAVKNPQVLKNLDILAETIGTFKYTKKNNGVPKVFSILDVVKEMNKTMNADDSSFYKIPEEQDLLSQLLFLYEISGGNTAKWVDEDFRILRMSVDVSAFDGNEVVSNLNTIRQVCSKLFPNADCFLAGPAVQFAEINNKIVIGELTSFIVSLIAIAFLMVLVFGSLKMGLIGLIPNIMPLIIIGGIMGYLHIPLDVMTMTIMPMLLGIAVDDTIHFTNHSKYVFENEQSYIKANRETFSEIGKTLAMTTIILSATFLMYMASKIDAVLRLGVLAAVGLLSALVTDYFVTPALIYITKPFGKEREEKSE